MHAIIHFHKTLDTSWFVSWIYKLFLLINKSHCATRSQKNVVLKKTEVPHIFFLLTISMTTGIINQRKNMQNSVNAKTKTSLLTSINSPLLISRSVQRCFIVRTWNGHLYGCVCVYQHLFFTWLLETDQKNKHNTTHMSSFLS